MTAELWVALAIAAFGLGFGFGEAVGHRRGIQECLGEFRRKIREAGHAKNG
jgi:hypothetical protein